MIGLDEMVCKLGEEVEKPLVLNLNDLSLQKMGDKFAHFKMDGLIFCLKLLVYGIEMGVFLYEPHNSMQGLRLEEWVLFRTHENIHE